MFKGRFRHKNILEASPLSHELAAGWMTHYFTGAVVAVTYPLFYLVLKAPMPESSLMPGLLWGLATTLLPWFILFPAFGWGFFGVRAPAGTRPLISTTYSHLLYGLGVGIVLSLIA